MDAVLRRDRRGLRHDRQVALEGREHRLGECPPPCGGLQLPAADRARAPEGADERDGAEAVAHEVASRPGVGGRVGTGSAARSSARLPDPEARALDRDVPATVTRPELDDVAAALQPAAAHRERALPGAHLQPRGADHLARLALLDAYGDRRGLGEREGDPRAAPDSSRGGRVEMAGAAPSRAAEPGGGVVPPAAGGVERPAGGRRLGVGVGVDAGGVAVGVGVGVGSTGSPVTVIVPCISGEWMMQTYSYVPGCVNV